MFSSRSLRNTLTMLRPSVLVPSRSVTYHRNFNHYVIHIHTFHASYGIEISFHLHCIIILIVCPFTFTRIILVIIDYELLS